MPAAWTTTAALAMGPVIAKVLLRSWIGDEPGLLDVSKGLLDTIISLSRDTMQARQIERRLSEAGERIAVDVLKAFEDDGIMLTEGGRASAIEAATRSLEQTAVEHFISEDLDPDRVSAALLSDPASRPVGLNEAETSLYQRIVVESCRRIVDVGSQFPRFTERAFAEILQRESGILELTSQVLEQARIIRVELARLGGNGGDRLFEAAYREAVGRKLNHIELFGADLRAKTRRHPLSAAYIPMPAQRVGENQATRTQFLAKKRLLIQGPAGCGKTTLLKWTAVQIAARRMTESLSKLNEAVPFYFRLRQFASDRLPKPSEFVEQISQALAGREPTGWTNRVLATGRAIVLIDGLDELNPARRIEVLEWTSDLVGVFPTLRVVVSTRPYALTKLPSSLSDFERIAIQPMEPGQVREFVERWHTAIAQNEESQDEESAIEADCTGLQTVVASNRAIRSLSTNPLLCAMICALHRDRSGNMPRDRMELYEACISMLLERRDMERRVSMDGYPALSLRQKQTVSEEVSYWMLRNELSEAPIEAVDKTIERILPTLGLKSLNAQSVRALLVERTGLVRQPAAGTFDFAHRTFQEYLGARAIVQYNDVGFLSQRATEDAWSEVVVLVAGHAGPQVAAKLIMSLLKRGNEEEHNRHALHLLAVACLETAARVPPIVRERISEALRDLIPPRNLTEARALANAGELALPFLQYRRKLKAREVAACVRTLSTIGGQAALDLVKGYAFDPRQTVKEELVRSWDGFSDYSDEYGRDIISKIDSPTRTLNRTKLSDIRWFRGVEKLEGVGLRLGPDGLSPLRSLQSLRQISLHSTRGEPVRDFSPLWELPRLEQLSLRGLRCEAAALSPVKQTSLTRLSAHKLLGCSVNLEGFAGLQSACLSHTVFNGNLPNSLNTLGILNSNVGSDLDTSNITKVIWDQNSRVLSLKEDSGVRVLATASAGSIDWVAAGRCGRLDTVEFRDTFGIAEELQPSILNNLKHLWLRLDIDQREFEAFVAAVGPATHIHLVCDRYFLQIDEITIPPTQTCTVYIDSPFGNSLKQVRSITGVSDIVVSPGRSRRKLESTPYDRVRIQNWKWPSDEVWFE